MRLAELRFDLRNSIKQVKEFLERKFGTAADQMTLQLHDTSDTVVCTLADDNETLASYGPQAGYTIHVFDANPMSQLKGLEDVSQVQKYEISEEAYAKRDGTFRQFK